MPYRKRQSSRVLETAELRSSGLSAIDPELDFGKDRSIKNLNQEIEQLRDKINAYNTALTEVDTLLLDIIDSEKRLGSLSEQMLIAVANEYGNDSQEYQMAGGVRKRDRIRRSSVARLKSDE